MIFKGPFVFLHIFTMTIRQNRRYNIENILKLMFSIKNIWLKFMMKFIFIKGRFCSFRLNLRISSLINIHQIRLLNLNGVFSFSLGESLTMYTNRTIRPPR